MSSTETTIVGVTKPTAAEDYSDSPTVMAEEIVYFDSYGAAAQAACLFVRPAPPEQQLRFYISRLGPATGKRVGLGLPGTSSVLDIVRLDNDDVGKGIHFNARRRAGDNSEKLAAVIRPTVGMSPAQRQAQYFTWLAPLEYVATPVTLWNAWRAGIPPRLAAEGALGEGDIPVDE